MRSHESYKRFFTLIIILISSSNFAFSQLKTEIEDLLTGVYRVHDSKDIIKDEYALKISDYGEAALDILPDFFLDDSKTEVYSECLKRKLTKGEIAIILCDRIEIIPYFQLIDMQNFGLSFCQDNPNFVESYLNTIKKQSAKKFKERYVLWLHSEERKNTRI